MCDCAKLKQQEFEEQCLLNKQGCEVEFSRWRPDLHPIKKLPDPQIGTYLEVAYKNHKKMVKSEKMIVKFIYCPWCGQEY